MDRNVEFLNYVYQNARMGSESIHSLIPKVQDQQLVSDLQTQLSSYDTFAQTAQHRLESYHQQPKDSGFISKATVHAGIAINTVLNNRPDHVAEMMINGSTMGIIDITKKLHDYADCKTDIKQIGQDLLADQQNHIERLKTYL